jgi:hypothetical protein
VHARVGCYSNGDILCLDLIGAVISEEALDVAAVAVDLAAVEIDIVMILRSNSCNGRWTFFIVGIFGRGLRFQVRWKDVGLNARIWSSQFSNYM